MREFQGRIAAISISDRKGVPKNNIDSAILQNNFGIVGDAHAGSERQVSLLAYESIEYVQKKGLKVKPGNFAENITVAGVNFSIIDIGVQIKIGSDVLLEVTQKGKVCHDRCWIYKTLGDCVMPKEGIFAKVLNGGHIKKGDSVHVAVQN